MVVMHGLLAIHSNMFLMCSTLAIRSGYPGLRTLPPCFGGFLGRPRQSREKAQRFSVGKRGKGAVKEKEVRSCGNVQTIYWGQLQDVSPYFVILCPVPPHVS